MVKVALLVRLEAKPGKETAVAEFLEGALPLVNEESNSAGTRQKLAASDKRSVSDVANINIVAAYRKLQLSASTEPYFLQESTRPPPFGSRAW